MYDRPDNSLKFWRSDVFDEGRFQQLKSWLIFAILLFDHCIVVVGVAVAYIQTLLSFSRWLGLSPSFRDGTYHDLLYSTMPLLRVKYVTFICAAHAAAPHSSECIHCGFGSLVYGEVRCVSAVKESCQ